MTHLDEGTIHAWLDGALGADDAAEVERHFATCDECAARVAEARGLIAGASRILLALDDVGAEIVPARAPEVKHRRTRPRATRAVAWLAAAGLLLAVGLETRAKMGPAMTPTGGAMIDPLPVSIAKGSVDSVQVIKGAPGKSVYGSRAGNGPISVAVPRAKKSASAPAAATVVAPKNVARSAVVDSPARKALPRAAAEGLKLQDAMVVTGLAGTAATQEAPAVLGRVPMCFEELPATPAMAPLAADAQRSAAKAGAARSAVGAVSGAGGAGTATAAANDVQARLAPNVLMLDSTPASPSVTGSQTPKLLLNSAGVAGEWQRLGTKGATGNDSVVLRFGAPAMRVVRAELAPEGLKVGARVMVWVRCGSVKP